MNNKERIGFSPKEVMSMTGFSRSFIYKMISQGTIKAIRIGERRLIIPAGEIKKLTEVGQ